MILVVLGHCIGYVENPINKIILSFHMPLFFFLAGCCAKRKNNSWKNFVKHKLDKYLPAQLWLAVICMSYDFLTMKKINIIFDLFVWFLPVLFYTELLFQLMVQVGKIKLFVILSLCSVIILNYFSVSTISHIEITPMAFLFYESGYLYISRKNNKICINSNIKRILCVLSILCMVIITSFNDEVLMYENRYGNLILFFVSSLTGIYLSCYVGMKAEKNNILIWIGKNSILIYVLHFKMTNVIHFFVEKCLFFKGDLYRFPYYVLVFGTEAICLFIIIEGINTIISLGNKCNLFRKG